MRFSLLLLALLPLPLFAADLPADAAALKSKRNAKIAEINRQYADELEKLQKIAMKNGSLEAANAIESEIAAAMPNRLKDSKTELLENTWIYKVPKGRVERVRFLVNGTAINADSGNKLWPKWEVSGNTLNISYPDGNGCVFNMENRTKGAISGKTTTGLVRTLERAQ